MTCLGVLDTGERGNNNGTSLKEGGGIEMSIYSAFHIRDASLSFAFELLTFFIFVNVTVNIKTL